MALPSKYKISAQDVKSPKVKLKETSEDNEKISKEAVLYIFRPETQYTCSMCVFAKDKATVGDVKKCKIFGPSTDIKAWGACGFWVHMDPTKQTTPEIPWIGVVTKEESGYTENKEGFSCKRCEYFDLVNMDCHKVDKDSKGDTPGIIHPNACCNAWEPDDIRAYLKPDALQTILEKALEKK